MTEDVETILPGEGDWPERTLVVPNLLQTPNTEEPYLQIATDLATEYGQLLHLLAQIRTPRTEGRDGAILRGLAVRCGKLAQRLVAETLAGHGEMQYLLDRELFDSTVDIAYLLRGGADRFEAFIQHHLQADRAVWHHIERNVVTRDGERIAHEDRMTAHLNRSFALAGVAPGVPLPADETPWPSLDERLEAIGEPRAGAMHQLGSFAVNGLWNEIISYHLMGDELFDPKLTWGRPRVEPLLAMAIQGSRIMAAYALRMGYDVSDAFRGRFLDLARRTAEVDSYLELYRAAQDARAEIDRLNREAAERGETDE